MNGIEEYTSLCKVYKDSANNIRLYRIADIQDGKLAEIHIDNDMPKQFGNRDMLYMSTGPQEEGFIGIWNWTAEVNTDKDHFADLIHSYYAPDLNPVRVVVLRDINSIQELTSELSQGKVRTNSYICDTIFCFSDLWSHFIGVLCKANSFSVVDKFVKFKKAIYSLPCYHFKTRDICNWDDKNLRFLRTLSIGEPEEFVVVGNTDEAVKSIILSRFTWPTYKECIGRTKADWRDCKTLMEYICSDSLYEEIAEKLSCSIQDAKEQIKAFLLRSSNLIEEGDIDSEVLSQVALHHNGLRGRCEAIIEAQWQAEHKKDIEEAEAETEKIKKASADIIKTQQKRFDQIHQEREQAKAEKASLLKDIANAQDKLSKLNREIVSCKALGTDVLKAVRDKIGAAKADMAGFIADISVFMPQSAVSDSSPQRVTSANCWQFVPGCTCEAEDNAFLDDCENWEDTKYLLRSNLKIAGVGNQWTDPLSSFLYSAYLNKMPLLLAGPNAREIADAFAMSICGSTVSLLQCHGDPDADAVSGFAESQICAVENPFHPDWISSMVDYKTQSGFCFWLHPYTEDLAIEPRSILNYALPVFTDCFVDRMPSWQEMTRCRNAEAYGSFKSTGSCRAKSGYLRKLGTGKLLFNRLEKVLTDAKCMQGANDAAIDFLFALLPICTLTGKQELLGELLSEEKSLSADVSSEIQRYLEG